MRNGCGWGVALALVGAVVRAETFELRYEVERLGGAEAVEVAGPGAEGSAHALRLTYKPAEWSRFNWPVFKAVPGAEAVGVALRREGEAPVSVQVRVQRADGVEWQSAALKLEQTWQTYRLEAKDFRFYRGGEKDAAGTLSLGEVTQVQVVPLTKRAGGRDVIWADEVRVLPEGPVYTHEAAELRRLETDPAELEFGRMNDLRRRWSAEIRALGHARQSASCWRQALGEVVAAARRDGQAQAAERLAGLEAVWLQPPAGPDVEDEPSALPPLERAAFGARLAAYESAEVAVLTDYAKAGAVRHYTMYQAERQAAPEVFEAEGERRVRQRVRFSDKQAQQVVFLTLDLPQAETDVDGRRIAVRMRCTAKGLNEKQPMVLRLNSRNAEGAESWAQFRPQPLPGAAWGEAVFALESPAQSVRFNPHAVRQVALRIENVPGQADDFVVELGPMRLGWPEATGRVRAEEVAAIEARVREAREALFAERAACARLEDELAAFPELARRYWAGFEQVTPRREATALPVFAAGTEPEAEFESERVRFRTRIEDGQVALEIEQSAGASCAVAAELRSEDGGTVAAAGRAEGARLRLAVPQAALWQAGNVHRYLLLVRVSRGEETVAALRRTVGLRTSEMVASGATTVLRHAVQRRWPEWSMRVNGRGTFGRFAAYSLPERGDVDASVRRLFDELWVDGVRHYGFKVSARLCGEHERQGVSLLAGAAPSFRSLTGWRDVEGFLDGYAARCARLDGAADSAAVTVLQVGNEVELAEWGADITGAFPLAPYQPIDGVAETAKRQGVTGAPVMYVRAGRFSVIPPMPHEDVCGVNQYTGRYSGRMEEIERDLAELAVQSVFANRPLMITEWMGPKYSWASGGIGGVTTRGAAYYLERYWRAMVDTPGIVGSSEFTLNWVIAPFEDLTNQTREEAWRERLPHSTFSGLNPAEHVPLLMPGQVTPDECYRAMQAFHGPVYVLSQRPGAVAVVHSQAAGEAAQRLALRLQALGKEAEAVPEASWDGAAAGARHLVVLLEAGAALERRLVRDGVIDPCPAGGGEPVIQTRLHPQAPDRLLVALTAPDAGAFARGLERLEGSAGRLVEFRRKEGAMGRVLAVTDAGLERVYTRYILEQAARGYLVAGEDTCAVFREAEHYRADGSRRAAWEDWAAVILDCARALSDEELALVKRVCGEGVNVVVSRACYRANPALQAWCGGASAEAAAGALTGRFTLASALSGPIPVKELGGADAAVIARFAPKHAGGAALEVAAVAAGADGEVWARAAAGGEPVVVAWRRGRGRVVVFGCDFGRAAEVHWDVTHAGEAHRLYDRDTACGLERVSRCVVNACLAGREPERMKPRLFIRVTPEAVMLGGGSAAVARAEVLLCDVEGRPVAGELKARARMCADGMTSGGGAFTALEPAGPGRFLVTCGPEGLAEAQVTYAPPRRMGTRWTVLSTQFKAYAAGHVPADGAAAFVVTE